MKHHCQDVRQQTTSYITTSPGTAGRSSSHSSHSSRRATTTSASSDGDSANPKNRNQRNGQDGISTRARATGSAAAAPARTKHSSRGDGTGTAGSKVINGGSRPHHLSTATASSAGAIGGSSAGSGTVKPRLGPVVPAGFGTAVSRNPFAASNSVVAGTDDDSERGSELSSSPCLSPFLPFANHCTTADGIIIISSHLQAVACPRETPGKDDGHPAVRIAIPSSPQPAESCVHDRGSVCTTAGSAALSPRALSVDTSPGSLTDRAACPRPQQQGLLSLQRGPLEDPAFFAADEFDGAEPLAAAVGWAGASGAPFPEGDEARRTTIAGVPCAIKRQAEPPRDLGLWDHLSGPWVSRALAIQRCGDAWYTVYSLAPGSLQDALDACRAQQGERRAPPPARAAGAGGGGAPSAPARKALGRLASGLSSCFGGRLGAGGARQQPAAGKLPISPEVFRALMAEMVVSIKAMHGDKWRRGGIKPLEFLVDADNHLQLADNGGGAGRPWQQIFESPQARTPLAALLAPPEQKLPGNVVQLAFHYLIRRDHPAALTRGPADGRAADAWSLGATALGMLLPKGALASALPAIRRGRWNPPAWIPSDLAGLLFKGLLRVRP